MSYDHPTTFEWDPAKARKNLEKHGVGFEEASEVFTSGTDYLEWFDEAHSIEEDRFLALGPASSGLLLVVWTEPAEHAVRIISARRATPGETRRYYQAMKENEP